MDDFVFDQKAGMAFSTTKLAVDWYQKQYYLLLEENKMLQEECAALRKQLDEAKL